MKLISFSYLVIFTLSYLVLYALQQYSLNIPEDAKLNFTQLGSKYGLFVQEHDVVTDDGYILKLFHIPGDRDKTVLLMHGFLDSGDTFIVRGRGSLVAALASGGYDVWVGNYRGTTYSRRHKWLNPDEDSFWDFSFHEIGAYDLPAVIDYILQENNVSKLSAIGHSQGNMIFYVLGSSRPEYNEKINLMIALGPVCYLNTENFQYPLSAVFNGGPFINQVLVSLNKEELMSESSLLTYLLSTVCANRFFGYTMCAEGIFFQMAGKDTAEFGSDFFYTLIGHYPTGGSRKNFLHLTQIAAEKDFKQFDYGPSNLNHYNSTSPPVYDLAKVTMKIALFVGLNDKLTPMQNVDLLRGQLPNVVHFKVLDRPSFNHIDHIWGENMDRYLFPYVMNVLSKYT